MKLEHSFKSSYEKKVLDYLGRFHNQLVYDTESGAIIRLNKSKFLLESRTKSESGKLRTILSCSQLDADILNLLNFPARSFKFKDIAISETDILERSKSKLTSFTMLDGKTQFIRNIKLFTALELGKMYAAYETLVRSTNFRLNPAPSEICNKITNHFIYRDVTNNSIITPVNVQDITKNDIIEFKILWVNPLSDNAKKRKMFFSPYIILIQNQASAKLQFKRLTIDDFAIFNELHNRLYKELM